MKVTSIAAAGLALAAAATISEAARIKYNTTSKRLPGVINVHMIPVSGTREKEIEDAELRILCIRSFNMVQEGPTTT